MPKTGDFLFVYGTLMQEFNNEMSQFLAYHSHYVGDGFFQGKLYDVADFPGAVLSKNPLEKVYGSVFELKAPELVFSVLDVYEGIEAASHAPDLYKRLQVEAALNSGEHLTVWVYIYNLPTAHLRQIPSGKYIKP